MSTKKIVTFAAVGVAMCALTFFWLRGRQKPVPVSDDKPHEAAVNTTKRTKTAAQPKHATGSAEVSEKASAAHQPSPEKATTTTGVRTPQKGAQVGSAAPTEPEPDGPLLAEIDDLLDDDDYDTLLEHAATLVKHPNPEVRSKLALGLHWAGLRGLAGLTTMLGDPDPEVAQEALDYWKTALADIESSQDRAALLDAAYTVTGDSTSDVLVEDLLSEMMFIDDELVVAAHLIEMAKQSKNPSHHEKFIETMDSISMPDEDSENIQQAIRNLREWERQEKRERAKEEAAEKEVEPLQTPFQGTAPSSRQAGAGQVPEGPATEPTAPPVVAPPAP